jgi:hypothetical protein
MSAAMVAPRIRSRKNATQMKKLLVLQHVAREPLGILDPLLREAGLRIRYVNFAREPAAQVDIARYAGLIVLGGPMNVDQAERYAHLSHEIEILRVALDRGIPTLGICLGAQLMAAALGARVHPNPVREIGWYPLSRSRRLRSTIRSSAISTVPRYFNGMRTRSPSRAAPCTSRAPRVAATRRSVTAISRTACSSIWK